MKTKAKKSLGLKPSSRKGFVRAKKALGQHFLKSQSIVSDIVNAGNINTNDIVLEIGPGKGILTEKLLSCAGKIIAVEKDKELVEYLKEKFKEEIESEKLTLINKDILDFDITSYSLLTINYKLVANIPYYITAAIIKKFLITPHQPEHMVLLVQKEVAQRIVARPEQGRRARGKESVLSISVKAYGTPRYIKKVPARYFSPPPGVDSAILSIEGISKDFFRDIDEEKFFTVVKTGFAHKRKLLIRNIEPLTEDKRGLKEIFKLCDIPEKTRAEDISLQDWKCLTQKIIPQQETTQA